MTRIKLSKNGHTPFENIIGYNPQILEKWNALDQVLWKSSSLDKDLLEQIRRSIAFKNGCEYCMVKGGKPDFDKSNLKVSIATAFAELFCLDHHDITEAHFDILKEHFTENEISELCVFISFINASQKLGKIFNLTEHLQPNAVVNMKDIE